MTLFYLGEINNIIKSLEIIAYTMTESRQYGEVLTKNSFEKYYYNVSGLPKETVYIYQY